MTAIGQPLTEGQRPQPTFRTRLLHAKIVTGSAVGE